MHGVFSTWALPARVRRLDGNLGASPPWLTSPARPPCSPRIWITTRRGAVERGTSQGGDDIGLPILGVGRRDINNKSTHIPEKRFDIVESELGLDRQTPPGRADAEARCELQECERKGRAACEEESRYSRRKTKSKIADGRWEKNSHLMVFRVRCWGRQVAVMDP